MSQPAAHTNPASPLPDFSACVVNHAGQAELQVQVEGIRCPKCVFQIESVLQQAGVSAKVNFSTRRLTLNWEGAASRANALMAKLQSLGYQPRPFAAAALAASDAAEEKFLLRCLTVAGFASGNIMLISAALWTTSVAEMGEATRALLHWVSALIALPATVYAGRPFFASAWRALSHRRTNMDVPISVALILTSLMSLHEVLRHGEHAYFDSVVMLVFLLLIGRYLDKKVRGRARAAAADLLQLLAGTATILMNGQPQIVPIRSLAAGQRLLVAAGERIAADGVIAAGSSTLDSSLLTGETTPQNLKTGDAVVGGMLNLTGPLEITISKATEDSLLAEVVRLMEKAEQGNAHYVRLADRVARYYTPVVHILALGTFLVWLSLGLAWQPALLIAATVLIITCPCALGLAVPAVQVIASTRLFKQGILLKAGDALERLTQVTDIVFDKTGTLTLGHPQLQNAEALPPVQLALAAALARASKHPLAQALHPHITAASPLLEVTEHPGQGLSATHEGQIIRLGSRAFCGVAASDDPQLELWLKQGEAAPMRLLFADALRPDAVAVVQALQQQGYQLAVLSGDRAPVAASVAAQLGIRTWLAGQSPLDKANWLAARRAAGSKVLMVGDGLNDAAALTAAHVSMSPSSALDITQNAADIVFQGQALQPVLVALRIAQRSTALVKQNFVLSFAYNIVAVPFAMLGHVTPLIAAIAMAASSLAVVLNAQRLQGGR